jgi:hypothetical protein
LFLFWFGAEIEPRALYMLSTHSNTKLYPNHQNYFFRSSCLSLNPLPNLESTDYFLAFVFTIVLKDARVHTICFGLTSFKYIFGLILVLGLLQINLLWTSMYISFYIKACFLVSWVNA